MAARKSPSGERMPLATKDSVFMGILSDSFVHVLIVIALGFAIYISTSDAPFVFDDSENISHNPAMKDMRYFTDGEFLGRALSNKEVNEHFRSRIFGYFTFALNYRLHGMQVQGYHVFNLMVHLANSAMIYLLVLLTTRTPWFRGATADTEDPVSYRVAAFFAALLFVSHPVQTEAVTYITQRFTSLATMLCILSLVLYIKARLEAEAKRTLLSTSTLTYYFFSIIAVVLAMKTKQISFTLPLVITLYEVMFFEGKAGKRIYYLLPMLLTMLIIPIATLEDKDILTDMGRLSASIQGRSGENEAVGYLLTQFRVIITYLRLLILPVSQNLDYDYPVYHSFLNPEVLLSFILLVTIVAGGVYLYCRSRNAEIRDRQWLRLAAFGIFWFFITLSVESSVIPLVDIIFEHRVYLPSVGFFTLIVSGAAIGKKRFAP
ncbi:MAG: hypothetical protein PH343_08080, partial [Nitrospira sp.]|nr:hypothetical protein [Nitrospira sp.]